jgi:putative transposase
MGKDQMKELERLQKGNDHLRRAISDLTLEKLILKEAARGDF